MTVAGAPATPASNWRQMLPREHGAWGLLLQPFLAGAILGRLPAGQWVPALLLLLGGLMIRSPLLFAARGWLLTRGPAPGGRVALAWIFVEAVLIVGCLWVLWPHLPHSWRAAVASGGPLFTAAAVWVSAANRQRSRLYQSASAAVLACSAPFALALSHGATPAWGWALWLVFVLHSSVAIQLVHERLERRIAARRTGSNPADPRPLFAAMGCQIAGGVALVSGNALWALPPALSTVLALAEWRRLRRPDHLREPLTRVGWRTLTYSVLHLSACVYAFWPAQG